MLVCGPRVWYTTCALNIVYQGQNVETDQTTLAGFLETRGVDAARAIVECAGEIYAPGADLAGVPLVEQAAIDVFRVTAGG